MNPKLLSEEVQQFIKDHQHDDPFLLSLKSKMPESFPLREAIEQIHARQKAMAKLPSWISAENIYWPAPLSVEQASSELTASFKATLIHGKSKADLTGGMGVDTFHFAQQFEWVHFVEHNAELASITSHNLQTLGQTNISFHQTSAEEFLQSNRHTLDAVFMDPSRRQGSRKVFMLEDCIPNPLALVPECLRMAEQVLLKLSPMVDIASLIRHFEPSSIWVLAVKNEVKEVLCLVERVKKVSKIHAVDLAGDGIKSVFSFKPEDEADAGVELSMPMQYLYESSSTMLKAGAFKLAGRRFGLGKLHSNSHLYTSAALVNNFPGRVFALKGLINPDKKFLKSIVPDSKINVVTRNYPLTPEQLKKKLGLTDGGDHYLIGTTLMDGKKALLFCERII
jgi:hypothetical protein